MTDGKNDPSTIAATAEISPGPDAWAALWRSLKHIDRSKVNKLPIAICNAIAVAVPLGIGIAIGNPQGGVAVTIGALNVSYSDGTDPYAQRARRMLAWSFIGAIAVFTGSIARPYEWAATLITMAWAFLAGMQLSISPRAGDLGLNTLVALIVFSARGPTDVRGIIYGTLLVLGGGLLQTGFALLFWPLRSHKPERRALASVYQDLAHDIATPSNSLLATPLKQPAPEVQDTLNALGKDYTVDGERFRMLFDQVDRIRLSAFAVQRLQTEDSSSKLRADIQQLFASASQLLVAIGGEIVTEKEQPAIQAWGKQFQDELSAIHEEAESAEAHAQEISKAADVFAGQIRSVARLAERTSPVSAESQRLRRKTGSREQFEQWIGILHANLSFQSATCRHAIRMAICVGAADALSRTVSWERSYWIPMTAAVILKPDFTTTISRGFLRLLGTLAGLMLATLLYHAIPPSALAELLLVGLFTFVLRMYGPANYGIFSVAITGLIVFLIAETGVSPAEVVALRGTNTVAGGLLALLAYVLWPTWERNRVSDHFAEMIDATRLYFRTLMDMLIPGTTQESTSLEDVQDAWRRARSNAEGSVDKVSSEPNFSASRLNCLTSMLSSSHMLVEVMREMEAETLQMTVHQQSPALQSFTKDVEFTLYYLSAALRGSVAAAETLPKLREDHRRLVQARSSLGAAEEPVLLGTDRITTALNTLREQVMRYLGSAADTTLHK